MDRRKIYVETTQLVAAYAYSAAHELKRDIKTFSKAIGMRNCQSQPCRVAMTLYPEGNVGSDVSVRFEIMPTRHELKTVETEVRALLSPFQSLSTVYMREQPFNHWTENKANAAVIKASIVRE